MELLLIRGLPGSGKSTLAKSLVGKGYHHLEADMYFVKDGIYRYDAHKIKDAHQWCQDTARSILSIKGINYEQTVMTKVVVSNTFTTSWELVPYFKIAKEFHIVPQVVTCYGMFNNVHNVPPEVLVKMKKRFEHDISDLYDTLGYNHIEYTKL